MTRAPFFLALFLALFVPTAHAQQQIVKVSSGTGFFVSRDGHILTNAHVVRACQDVELGGAMEGRATIIARDDTTDLAILKAERFAPYTAPLRWNLASLRAGENVTLLGYPGQAGLMGQLFYTKAKLIGLVGPTGEPHYLQFTSSAQKGNSGGPLIDSAGNVIGVVTGKTKLYQIDPTGTQRTPLLVREADVAVTLQFIKEFLSRNKVSFASGTGGIVGLGDTRIVQDAKRYTVHIRCLVQ
jgi:serine protease Do